MTTNERRKMATANAIKRIAYFTATQSKGQRQKDAIAHCKQLGVDHTAKTFAEAIA